MLRPTTKNDVKQLVALAKATGVFQPQELDTVFEVYDEYFFNEHEKGHLGFTWEQDQQIQGFIYIAPASLSQGTWELWWIAVEPSFQGKGLGSKMLRHAEELIRNQGGRQIYIDTSSAPLYEPTRNFYLRHGYQEAGRLPDYYAVNDDKVIYRKVISNKP